MAGARTRILELDALRGLAAFCVVAYHYTQAYTGFIGWKAGKPLFEVHMPRAGVAIFFVLSGFVIFNSLEHARSATDFAVRRFARLFPPYWAALAFVSFLMFGLGCNFRQVPPSAIPANITMLAPLFSQPSLEGSYWTLTRELVFYALAATMFYSGGRHAMLRFTAIWLAIAVIGNVVLLDPSPYFALTWRSTLGLMLNIQFAYLFCAGMMLYLLRTDGIKVTPIIILMAALSASGFSEYGVSHSYNLSAIGSTTVYVCLVAVCASVPIKVMRSRLLLQLGAISYSLYLVHDTLGFFILERMQAFRIDANLCIVAAISASIGVASLMRKFVEIPAEAFIRRVVERPG